MNLYINFLLFFWLNIILANALKDNNYKGARIVAKLIDEANRAQAGVIPKSVSDSLNVKIPLYKLKSLQEDADNFQLALPKRSRTAGVVRMRDLEEINAYAKRQRVPKPQEQTPAPKSEPNSETELGSEDASDDIQGDFGKFLADIMAQQQDKLKAEQQIIDIKKNTTFNEGKLPRLVQSLEKIDPSFNPCEQFYEFSCNGWIQEAKREYPDSAVYSVTDQVHSTIAEYIANVFENGFPRKTALKTPPKERKVLRETHDKMMAMYDSCTNVKALNNEGITALQPYLKVIRDAKFETGADYAELFGSLNKLNVEPIFRTLITTHPKRKYRRVVALDMGRLLFPLTVYKCPKCKLLYTQLVSMALHIFHMTPQNSNVHEDWIANKLFDLETKLGGIRQSIHKRRNSQHYTFNFVSVNDLQKRFGHVFRFATYYRHVGFSEKIDQVLVEDLALLEKLFDLIEKTHPEVLRAYFAFTLIMQYSYALPPRMVDGLESMRQLIVNVVNFQPDIGGDNIDGLKLFPSVASSKYTRADICFEKTSTEFELLLSRYFVDEYYSELTTSKAKKLTLSLKNVFKQRIEKSEWLDKKTKRSALLKLEKLDTSHVGFPEWIMDNEALAELEDVNYDPLKFLASEINITISNHFDALDMFSTVRDTKYDFHSVPSETSGSYIPDDNSMSVSGGFMMEPFLFKDHKTHYMELGTLGMVIGHELTHGFDDSGRLRGPRGESSNWWTAQSERHFKSKSKCFDDFYSKCALKIDGTKKNMYINGSFTLGENIADNGGLVMAFEAWKEYAAEHGINREKPVMTLGNGYTLTRDRMFFVSFGQLWCSIQSPKMAKQLLTIDPHSPNSARVAVTALHHPEFAKVFNCPKSSAMHLEDSDKCTLW